MQSHIASCRTISSSGTSAGRLWCWLWRIRPWGTMNCATTWKRCYFDMFAQAKNKWRKRTRQESSSQKQHPSPEKSKTQPLISWTNFQKHAGCSMKSWKQLLESRKQLLKNVWNDRFRVNIVGSSGLNFGQSAGCCQKFPSLGRVAAAMSQVSSK